jgi:hypothetical protein
MFVGNQEIRISGRLLRIARVKGDTYQFVSDPKALIAELRKCGQRIDLFTFMQGLPEAAPKYAYPMEWDNLAVLPISTYDNWWTNQVDCKTRNMARKAGKKDVEIRAVAFDEQLVRGIMHIYNEVRVRQGRKFSHYGKDYDTVYKEEATFLDRSTFIGAFYGEELIGFIKLVADEARVQVGLMNIVSMIKHRDKSPTNALVAEAVRYCAEQNIPYLVYSNFTYGNKQKDSIAEFKENNGFNRVDLPRYYVPLTLFGRLAFQFGFHRRLVDRIPQPLVERFRELRNQWNNRKLRPSRNAS